MASAQRILSLNLGSQMVRLAEFRSDNRGGLVLTAYRTSELLADPATDATRVSQTSIAVQELVGELKLSGKVNYAIPAQSVFTRFVKLPSVGEEKVEQIVEFEAQQNVPFPINEVVWDYQLVSSSDPGKLEVVLVAIKSDLLEELNVAVEGSGRLKTNVVDVAPMALFNAFRYNYSDISGCSLLVDIGARTTNLIFIESKKIFTRSIPIGGNTITAAIAKDFNEPFSAAEERKKRQGFVSLGGAYADPDDPEVARISKVVRNTMTRLHAEISRSISFYRSQQGGSQPERVLLCGGAVGMPYMREFFSEKLALPIEFFNPLKNVAVGGNIDSAAIGRDAHLLGELVGIALRSSSECPMELSLRPASVVASQELSARTPYLAAAAACILVALGGWWYYNHQAIGAYQKVLEDLGPKVNELTAFEGKLKAASTEIKGRLASAEPLLKAVSEREYWARLIDDLNARLPSRYIWITSLEVGLPPKAQKAASPSHPSPQRAGASATAAAAPTGPHLIVKGLYLANDRRGEIVDEFAKALSESPFYTIDLTKKNEFNPVRGTQNDADWSFEYVLNLPLKQPIAQ